MARSVGACDKELRIVMVGKTGAGKSALGNNLLGEKKFISKVYGESITSKCDFGEKAIHNGKKLIVVDTPGLFDTSRSEEETRTELARCVDLSLPGPHAIFFVLKVDRYTEEKINTIKRLKDMFGKKVIDRVIIIFTSKDELEYQGTPIDEFIQHVPKYIKNLIDECKRRYVAINNRAKGRELEADIKNIMDMVEYTVRSNNNTYYTGKMWEEAEKARQEKERKIEEEKKRKEREWQEKFEIATKERIYKEAEKTLQERTKEIEKKKNRELQETMKKIEEENKRKERELQETKKKIEEENKRKERELQETKKKIEEENKRKERELQETMKKTEEENKRKERELQKKIEIHKIVVRITPFCDETIGIREKMIKKLKDVIGVLNKMENDVRISKVTGKVAGAVGSGMVIGGLVGAIFTLGASLIVSAVGAGVGVAGGVTAGGASLAHCDITKKKLKEVEELVKDDSGNMNQISYLLKNLRTIGVDLSIEDPFVKDPASDRKTKLACSDDCSNVGEVLVAFLLPMDFYTIISNSIDINENKKHAAVKSLEGVIQELKCTISKIENLKQFLDRLHGF